MTDIRAFASNVYSQGGEDGILAEIFRRLQVSAGYFTEFGAWDGMHLSNACALVERGWSGLYIEGDPDRFKRLCQNGSLNGIRKVQRYIAVDGPDSLDNILDEAAAPSAFDLLSIDIDGDDLAVWRGVSRHRATCVVIEYNPTIPFDCLFENPPGRAWGNSAKSIDTFAREAGYALVAATGTNLIYLDEGGPLEESGISPLALEDVAVGQRYFWGFDGSLLIADPDADADAEEAGYNPELFRVPWANTVAVQPIPKVLRRHEDRSSRLTLIRLALAAATAAVSRPAVVATRLSSRARDRVAR